MVVMAVVSCTKAIMNLKVIIEVLIIDASRQKLLITSGNLNRLFNSQKLLLLKHRIRCQ